MNAIESCVLIASRLKAYVFRVPMIGPKYELWQDAKNTQEAMDEKRPEKLSSGLYVLRNGGACESGNYGRTHDLYVVQDLQGTYNLQEERLRVYERISRTLASASIVSSACYADPYFSFTTTRLCAYGRVSRIDA